MDAKFVKEFIKCLDGIIHATSRMREVLNKYDALKEMQCREESLDTTSESSEVQHRKTKRAKLPLAKCEKCGKEFQPRRLEQRFCSNACRLAVVNSEEKTHICPTCGKEFKSAGRRATYCSRACQAKHIRNEKKLQEKQDQPTTRECLVCGEKFTPVRKNSKFCCRECAIQYYNYKAFLRNHPGTQIEFSTWQRTPFPTGRKARGNTINKALKRTCQFCGRDFIPTTDEQKYCSKACKFEAHEQSKEKMVKKETPVVKQPEIIATPTKDDQRTWERRECKVCHLTFEAAKGTNVRYCPKCLSHYGYRECVELEKEENEKRDIEKNKSQFKVCSKCGAYFTDTTPTRAQLFCERCRKKLIGTR